MRSSIAYSTKLEYQQRSKDRGQKEEGPYYQCSDEQDSV